MDLPRLIGSARRTWYGRWTLNALLSWNIPFNGPHGFKVMPTSDGGMKVKIPHWRVNRNHIRGIHARAMATAAELSSGLSIMEHLDPRKFRLIMKDLRMEYHFQAKKKAYAISGPVSEKIQSNVIGPLKQQASVEYESTVRVQDSDGAHLATGRITWQVKEWEKVRTKI